MTIHWKTVEQYFTVVQFIFKFFPVYNFGKFINFRLESVRSERVKIKNVSSVLEEECVMVSVCILYPVGNLHFILSGLQYQDRSTITCQILVLLLFYKRNHYNVNRKRIRSKVRQLEAMLKQRGESSTCTFKSSKYFRGLINITLQILLSHCHTLLIAETGRIS